MEGGGEGGASWMTLGVMGFLTVFLHAGPTFVAGKKASLVHHVIVIMIRRIAAKNFFTMSAGMRESRTGATLFAVCIRFAFGRHFCRCPSPF